MSRFADELIPSDSARASENIITSPQASASANASADKPVPAPAAVPEFRTTSKTEEKHGSGPVIGVVIFVLAAALAAGLYFKKQSDEVNGAIGAVNSTFSAVASEDIEKMKSGMSAAALAETEAKGGFTPEMIAMIKAFHPAAVKTTKVTINGNNAVIYAVPDDPAFNVGKGTGNGTIKLTRENGQWKVDKVDWVFSMAASAYVEGGSLKLKSLVPAPQLPEIPQEYLGPGNYIYTGQPAEFFDGTTPQQVYELLCEDTPEPVFSADGRYLLAAVYGNFKIGIYDVYGGFAPVSEFTAGNRPTSAAAAPDGTYFAVGDAYGGITVIPLPPGSGENYVIQPGGVQVKIAISPNSKLIASVSQERELYFIDPVKKMAIAQKTGGMPRMACVAFLPQAPYLFAGNYDKTFEIWDMVTGKGRQFTVSKVTKSSVVAAAFSPDGKKFVTAHNDSSIVVFDTETQKETANFFIQDAATNDVAFSPDGKLFATAHQNGNVYLWKADDASRLAMIKAHAAGCTHISFSPDGTKLATGGEDKYLRVWGR